MALVISATHPAAVAGSIHGSAYAGTPDTHRWFLDLRSADPRTGDAHRVGCWFCASYDVARERARTHCNRHYRNTARVVSPDETHQTLFDCHGIVASLDNTAAA
jgi:hypothetical protein